MKPLHELIDHFSISSWNGRYITQNKKVHIFYRDQIPKHLSYLYKCYCNQDNTTSKIELPDSISLCKKCLKYCPLSKEKIKQLLILQRLRWTNKK